MQGTVLLATEMEDMLFDLEDRVKDLEKRLRELEGRVGILDRMAPRSPSATPSSESPESGSSDHPRPRKAGERSR